MCYAEHSKEERAKKKIYNVEHSDEINAKMRLRYQQTPEKKRKEDRKARYDAEETLVAKPVDFHLESYREECKNTPIFPCICCHKLKFQEGIKPLSQSKEKISKELFGKSCHFDESFKLRNDFLSVPKML